MDWHVSEEYKTAIDQRMRKVLDEQINDENSGIKTAFKKSVKHLYQYAAVLAVGLNKFIGHCLFSEPKYVGAFS